MKNNLTIVSFSTSALILMGLSITILIPLLLLFNLYSISQNSSILIKDVSQNALTDQIIGSSENEKHTHITQQLNSASNAIEHSMIFTPSFSYIPVLGQEIFAWKLETSRLITNLKTGMALSKTASSIVDSIKNVNEVYTSQASSSYILETEKLEFENIKAITSKSIRSMNKYKNLSNRHRPIFSPMLYLDNRLELQKNETLLFNTVSVINTLIDIVYGYTTIVELSAPFNTLISESPNTSNHTFSNLSESLSVISKDSYLLNLKTQSLISSIEDIEIYKKSTVQDLLFLLNIVFESITAISSTTEILISSIEANHKNNTGEVSERPVFAILDNINDHLPDLLQNLETIELSNSKMDVYKSRFTNEFLIGQIQTLQNRTQTMADSISLFVDLAPITNKLLNTSNPLRFLVLGHSSDELRATGGFVSSLWIIEVSKETNITTRYFDTVRVDDWTKLELYPTPPYGLKTHMNAHVWLLRDVSWEPDFPTTATIASDMFYLGQNIKVDGVIGINQWTLVELIEAIGDIKSPDGDLISPLNFLSKIEEGTDDYGRSYTDLILDGFIEKIFTSDSQDISFFISTAKKLNQLLNSKDITVHMSDLNIQKIISDKEWSGEIKSTSGDYLFIIDSNVGWSKSDRNIERKTYYKVDLSKNPPRANLKLRYFNHSGSGSVQCNPQWINRGTNYNQLKNACYWNYWRVYTPNNTEILSHTLLPIREFSVAAQVGMEISGNDSFGIESAYGYNVFSGLSDTEAGEETSINLIYDLPEEILRKQQNRIEYSLLIQKQSGVRKRSTEIELVLPANYKIISSSHMFSTKYTNRIFFQLSLTEDTVVDLVFEKIP